MSIKSTPADFRPWADEGDGLVVLLSGIAAAAAGIVYGVLGIMDGLAKTGWYLAKIGGGVLIYLFCASLARRVKPAQLNIKIGAGNAGDEAGIMAMFSKTVKIAPILWYGSHLLPLVCTDELVAKDDIESATSPAAVAEARQPKWVFKSMSNLTKKR